MDKKKDRRINYKVLHCSSEDPQYPVSELLLQSADAKGWLSRRFGTYPEYIVIELFETSLISKIAVLSHQSKIATRIEFEIRSNDKDDWRKLGRISLDSNANTNYQARELKQANINNVEARQVRLLFKGNHVNNQNPFNQIGIISLAFYGSRSEELPPLQERHNAPRTPPEVDNTTQGMIRELQARKKRAVEQEQYDLAKEIKEEIDRLKNTASEIAYLEQCKQNAIKSEDYDGAKQINQKIKRLRQGGAQPEREQKPTYKADPRREETEASVSPISNGRNTQQKQPQPLQEKPRQERREQKKEVYEPPAQTNPRRNIPKQEVKEDNEDRPINVKNSNPYEQPQEQAEQPETKKQSELQVLNKQLLDECSQFFSVFPEEVFQRIFSKDHNNRDEGVQMCLDELKNTRNREDYIGACLYVVKHLIDDKIATVLISAMNLMGEMMRKLKPRESTYNQPLVDYILERMADFLGHINEKVKNIAEDTYSSFPIYALTNKEVCYRALANPGKRDKAPKILVGRLKMLSKIVKQFQLGKNYEDVIKYAVKYADDKSNDVRTAAIALICVIAGEIGANSIQQYTKNLRAPILKAIQDKLEETGNSEQPQNFDEKPIKPKTSEKPAARGRQPVTQQLDVGNEFIQIPKKGGRNSVNESNQAITCQFCKRVDKRFVEQDYKDLHYFNACPMLSICGECGQGIEISSLTSHQVGECANSKYYKKCPRCKEAVHQKGYKAHVQKKECLPAKPMAANNRCPLCHLDINPGPAGWKEHLVDEGCENNPRA